EESFARSFSDGQRPKGNAQFLFGSLRKPELFHGFLFRFAVHRVALDQYFKIHLVCFKFRAIHAGKLALPVDQNTTAAAHASSIDHDGIETDNRTDIRRTSDVGYCLHHGNGPNGKHEVDMCAGIDQLAKLVGHEASFTITAVVGCDHQYVADGAHLALENYELFVASADDEQHAISSALQSGCRGVGHCSSHPAAHNHDRAKFFDFRRLTERADYVKNAVTAFKRVQKVSSLADRLNNNVDSPLVRIRSLDGERNPLAFFIDANDNELTRALLAGNSWSLDYETLDSGGNELRVDDFEHVGLERCLSGWHCFKLDVQASMTAITWR